MTDLSQMIRWQAGLVRGLAQSVLERAKNIRGSLETSNPVAAAAPKAKKAVKKTAKATSAKKKPVVRKTKKKHA